MTAVDALAAQVDTTPVPLDLLRVALAIVRIAKVAPDLTPRLSCNGTELDIQVPDCAAAVPLNLLLADGGDIRPLRGTPIYETGWAGTIAGVPVRVLVTRIRGLRGMQTRWAS